MKVSIKLGMDAVDTFSGVASLATSDQLFHEMVRFPHRRPKDRDLAAFFLREELTGGEPTTIFCNVMKYSIEDLGAKRPKLRGC